MIEEKKHRRKLRSQDYVLIFFFLLSAALTALLYRASVFRLLDSLWDFGTSVAYYFCALFGYEEMITPTVTLLPEIDVLQYLSYDFDELFRRLSDMWSMIFNKDCFFAYLKNVATFLNDFSVILMLLLPVSLCVWFVARARILAANKDKHGEKTKPMRRFEGKPLGAILAVRNWLVELYHTLVGRKCYLYSIILIWMLNLNIMTIIAGALAYYFYFAMAFDFLNLISIQLCKLILDMVIMLASAPLVFWIIVAYVIICKVRRYMGYNRLDNFENRNREFIDQQPICTLVCGLMGAKKTTTITDMALSTEIMHREKALQLMMEQDSKYPNFPWINLEDKIKDAFRHQKIYSLTTAREWVRKKEQRFLRCPRQEYIFDYNIDRYRYEYDNKLKVETVWDVIENYTQLYLIYTIKSSLILSNYSIRTDSVLHEEGNFPLWDFELFRKDPQTSQSDSRFCHILDFDLLRLGRQMLEDNPNRGSFEFGVVVITEIGKERGNNLTLQEIKKKVDECNQKNDLFNYGLKMCRHKATVCGFPFIRIFSDEQRPESLGADARDLFNVVYIRESSPFRLVMPCFFITEIIHDLIYPAFDKFRLKYKIARGDTCLSYMLLHNGATALHNYYVNTYNLFGISELKTEVEAGTLEGDRKAASYYISSKKDYSERFSTDCHRQHFEILLKNALVGLDDYATYESIIASAFEFKKQNSYFISDMENITAA